MTIESIGRNSGQINWRLSEEAGNAELWDLVQARIAQGLVARGFSAESAVLLKAYLFNEKRIFLYRDAEGIKASVEVEGKVFSNLSVKGIPEVLLSRSHEVVRRVLEKAYVLPIEEEKGEIACVEVRFRIVGGGDNGGEGSSQESAPLDEPIRIFVVEGGKESFVSVRLNDVVSCYENEGMRVELRDLNRSLKTIRINIAAKEFSTATEEIEKYLKRVIKLRKYDQVLYETVKHNIKKLQVECLQGKVNEVGVQDEDEAMLFEELTKEKDIQASGVKDAVEKSGYSIWSRIESTRTSAEPDAFLPTCKPEFVGYFQEFKHQYLQFSCFSTRTMSSFLAFDERFHAMVALLFELANFPDGQRSAVKEKLKEYAAIIKEKKEEIFREVIDRFLRSADKRAEVFPMEEDGEEFLRTAEKQLRISMLINSLKTKETSDENRAIIQRAVDELTLVERTILREEELSDAKSDFVRIENQASELFQRAKGYYTRQGVNRHLQLYGMNCAHKAYCKFRMACEIADREGWVREQVEMRRHITICLSMQNKKDETHFHALIGMKIAISAMPQERGVERLRGAIEELRGHLRQDRFPDPFQEVRVFRFTDREWAIFREYADAQMKEYMLIPPKEEALTSIDSTVHLTERKARVEYEYIRRRTIVGGLVLGGVGSLVHPYVGIGIGAVVEGVGLWLHNRAISGETRKARALAGVLNEAMGLFKGHRFQEFLHLLTGVERVVEGERFRFEIIRCKERRFVNADEVSTFLFKNNYSPEIVAFFLCLIGVALHAGVNTFIGEPIVGEDARGRGRGLFEDVLKLEGRLQARGREIEHDFEKNISWLEKAFYGSKYSVHYQKAVGREGLQFRIAKILQVVKINLAISLALTDRTGREMAQRLLEEIEDSFRKAPGDATGVYQEKIEAIRDFMRICEMRLRAEERDSTNCWGDAHFLEVKGVARLTLGRVMEIEYSEDSALDAISKGLQVQGIGWEPFSRDSVHRRSRRIELPGYGEREKERVRSRFLDDRSREIGIDHLREVSKLYDLEIHLFGRLGGVIEERRLVREMVIKEGRGRHSVHLVRERREDDSTHYCALKYDVERDLQAEIGRNPDNKHLLMLQGEFHERMAEREHHFASKTEHKREALAIFSKIKSAEGKLKAAKMALALREFHEVKDILKPAVVRGYKISPFERDLLVARAHFGLKEFTEFDQTLERIRISPEFEASPQIQGLFERLARAAQMKRERSGKSVAQIVASRKERNEQLDDQYQKKEEVLHTGIFWDGGGVKGVIPVTIASELETRIGAPLSRVFDLHVGTSTGGILAAGFNIAGPTGHPMHSAGKLLEIYTTRARSIFPSFRQNIIGSAARLIRNGSLYDATGLRTVVRVCCITPRRTI